MNEIMNINGIECFEKDGTAYLKLETVARGLGFTHREIKNGKEYESIRWSTVRTYLKELGFRQQVGEEIGFPTSGENDFIPENIFYRLAMKAKNEAAEKFQAKVADEIIPSIRKHGAYMTPQKIEEVLLNPDTIIKLATDLKAEREHRMALETKIEQDKPKTIFADAVSSSKTSILIGDMAKLLRQNGIEIGQKRLFDWLRNNGYLIKRKGSDWNMPTQRSVEMGLFEIKESTHLDGNGCNITTKTSKVTGKGQVYFINKFLKAI